MSAIALARHPCSTTPPLSLRAPWHRASILGALAVLFVFPWVTTTGCEGKDPPVTYTGYELLAKSLRTSDGLELVLGAVGLLVVSAGLGFLAPLIARVGSRFIVQIVAALTVVPGVFFTFVALAAPTATEVEQHHAAFAVTIAAFLFLIVDGIGRAIVGGREWWRERAARRKLGGAWPAPTPLCPTTPLSGAVPGHR